MKISIITVVFNARKTIERSIRSVLSQKKVDIEYILIDGGSTDGTAEFLKANEDLFDVFVSEPDKGIYDAMNKGISLSTGEIIGFLNSDDFYEDEFVLSNVLDGFLTKNVEAVYGDVVYFNQDSPEKVDRYYSSKIFKPKYLKYGIMPAHPSLFFKKIIYDKYGLFDPRFKIAGDFELVARIFGNQKILSAYIPRIMVRMQLGGISNMNMESISIINDEIIQACKLNGIKTSKIKILFRYLFKLNQLRFFSS
ncbi:glycosyltransferase family 2 protein [Polynucleobacter sp. AP-Jannik-300A-C4]|uniref:glycosyltransferase family 2 protein n=1 Tax=Polynucleobacter sp. AP-Jannik-300A-C4 TaxID=2576928 RepID=UPI001BFEDA60|nr:glycosyltransferase family 2 protein [Polynucleobacter sp. AP-Jannik-300A-C4]